ncbi:uncharacterized protein UHOD_11654 [Ustilago sp. UG-2017b]|nr:uncharacterized protein UHOD_11654 [Ustilago sp. UG-2017b]
MQIVRDAHSDWHEDQILECAFAMMNFQPNASQTEKIPKSVLSIISQIVKLNENNWAIWEPMFMDCIRPIKNAKRTLTGEIPCSLHGDHGLLWTHMRRRTGSISEESQAQPRRGPSSRSGHSHEEDQAQGACRQLPFRGSRDKSQRNRHRSKEEEQCIGDRQASPEEEEQCRRRRHSSGGQEWC